MFLTITEALKNDYQKYSKSAASAQEENGDNPRTHGQINAVGRALPANPPFVFGFWWWSFGKSRVFVGDAHPTICFRFWQEGPGHDRNLTSVENVINAADYIHHNPVRRGLCISPDQWRWSSWKHYHQPEEPPDPALPIVHGFPI